MKSEKEIREKIKKIETDYAHILNIPPASVDINAPRALMQIQAKAELNALYWVVGEKRPAFACDDFKKLNH
jgi:hypothetical protein